MPHMNSHPGRGGIARSDGVVHYYGGTIMARLTSITGKDQVPAEHHPIVDSIVASRGSVHGPFTMFLHCPPLAERVMRLGAYVRFEGKLDHRVRVLAAMTVAREFEAVYVWGAQTGVARRQGVPEATITAIREQHSRGIPAEDAQVVDFTRDLIRKHRADDATVKALRQRFGDEQFIELTGTIGYYSMLAMTVNVCELEARPGAEVLPRARESGTAVLTSVWLATIAARRPQSRSIAPITTAATDHTPRPMKIQAASIVDIPVSTTGMTPARSVQRPAGRATKMPAAPGMPRSPAPVGPTPWSVATTGAATAQNPP